MVNQMQIVVWWNSLGHIDIALLRHLLADVINALSSPSAGMSSRPAESYEEGSAAAASDGDRERDGRLAQHCSQVPAAHPGQVSAAQGGGGFEYLFQ